jgi:cell division transport system ATP-binding protein
VEPIEAPLISFQGVSKTYPNGTQALHAVNLAIPRQDFVFIVGPSGAGKSTLVRLLIREEKATIGRIYVDGQELGRLRHRHLPHLRRKIGIVFQDYKLLPRLTALENVAFGLQVGDLRIPDEEALDRSLDALEAVGLGDRGDAFPHQLSGGQQQRVAVARAVVAQPALLIADEPTGNLDLETAWEIMDLFEDIAAWGTAVLVATHNVEIVTRLQRRVLTLVHGRLVRDQPAGQTGRMAWLASS